MPEAIRVEPSATQSVPILLHSKTGEAGTDVGGDGAPVSDKEGRHEDMAMLLRFRKACFPLLAAAAPHASVPKGFASIAEHELERGGNFAFSTTAASTATASTAELQLRSGSQYVGGSCG